MNHDTAKTISTWLGILAMLGVIAARFITLEERSDNQTRWITELSGEVKELKQRVSALERDRAMLERVHSLELRLAAMEAAQKERRR